MAKETKENPYKKEQALLDIGILENATQKDIKVTIEKLQNQYKKIKEEQKEKSQKFINMYYNGRETLKALYDKVKNGELNPDKAIEEFLNYTTDKKLFDDRQE